VRQPIFLCRLVGLRPEVLGHSGMNRHTRGNPELN
jgi:hypothetical protein